MKLWLIKRPEHLKADYDDHVSAVVAADDQTAARHTHPSLGTWDMEPSWPGTWINPEDVIVEYLGEGRPDIEAGVICADFNAG